MGAGLPIENDWHTDSSEENAGSELWNGELGKISSSPRNEQGKIWENSDEKKQTKKQNREVCKLQIKTEFSRYLSALC